MDTAKLMALMAQKKQAMKRVERAAGFKPGKNRVRIAPGWRPGEEHIWYHDFGQHFIKDGAGQIQAVYMCNEATYGKPCATCQAIKAAIKSVHDDATAETIAQAVSSKAILVNMFFLDSEDPNTPVVTGVKGKLFAQLIDILEENGPEAFFDPDKGHEIVVTRDGKGLGTTYSATMSIKTGARIPASAYKKLTNLDDYVKQDNEEQERRAIAAVNSVAGLITGSAPGTPSSAIASAPVAAIGAPVGGAATPAAVDLDTELDSMLGLDDES